MITRLLVAGVLIPLVLASLFWGPLWVFLLLASVFQIAALWEFSLVLPHYGTRPLWLLFPVAVALPWLWNYLPEQQIPYLLAVTLMLLVSSLLNPAAEPRQMFLTASLSLFGLLYLGIPFSLVGELHPQSPLGIGSALELLLVMGAVWICDSAAYFVGRSFGKHRITPTLSPGKSLEGFIAGFVLGTAFTLYFSIQFLSLSFWVAGILALVLPLATIFGDLFESALKRGAGIKDTSHLIPGHGGVLDRLDSLLFAIPSYFVIMSFVP